MFSDRKSTCEAGGNEQKLCSQGLTQELRHIHAPLKLVEPDRDEGAVRLNTTRQPHNRVRSNSPETATRGSTRAAHGASDRSNRLPPQPLTSTPDQRIVAAGAPPVGKPHRVEHSRRHAPTHMDIDGWPDFLDGPHPWPRLSGIAGPCGVGRNLPRFGPWLLFGTGSDSLSGPGHAAVMLAHAGTSWPANSWSRARAAAAMEEHRCSQLRYGVRPDRVGLRRFRGNAPRLRRRSWAGRA